MKEKFVWALFVVFIIGALAHVMDRRDRLRTECENRGGVFLQQDEACVAGPSK